MTKKKSAKNKANSSEVETFDLEAIEANPAKVPRKAASKKKANKKRSSRDSDTEVVSYRHTDKRKNNPPVGLVKPENDPEQPKTTWAYDPHIDPALQFDIGRHDVEKIIDDALESGDESVMRAALEQLKRQSEPYLNWTGKAERTSFDVDTVSLHVHERIDPMSVLAALRKRVKAEKEGVKHQPDLFAAPFENLPLRDAIDFYKHERGWSNRLIAGDSLQVMNSLLQKESMEGQVQMIYIDPPYGIKYGSNFQPFVNKRDVKDRKDEDLTQEPEMIKAFRDTWELGLHSYLTYLKDRLLMSHDLLHESGSVFMQIGDDNLHHVREIVDEVFGARNFVSVIAFKKTAGQTSEYLPGTTDYILWYAKSRRSLKYLPLFRERELGGEGSDAYRMAHSIAEGIRRLSKVEYGGLKPLPRDFRPFRYQLATSQREGRPSGEGSAMHFPVTLHGEKYFPTANRGWTATDTGMRRLVKAGRIGKQGATANYIRYLGDFPAVPITNLWTDTQSGSGMDKVYVVQTNQKIVERCMLMTTDPGDLVLDPTCGSGTTAIVAETWGRRWITCDTSRVATTLAKQRFTTASFEYFELKYPNEGLKSGFMYKTVPHVTLKSIANNPEIDEIYERIHPEIEKALAELNQTMKGSAARFKVEEGGRKGDYVEFSASDSKKVPLPSGEEESVNALLEWEVPFDFPEEWPEKARKAFDAFHEARRAMQKRMDESIAAHADQEILYDQPKVSKNKLRITGPFTVEAVPFPSVVSLDDANPPQDSDAAIARSGYSSKHHLWRDELEKTGIRGKGNQMLKFAELESLPSGEGFRNLHYTGTLDSGECVVVSFGPEYAALEQRQVALALSEAEKLRPAPKFVVFAAFEFDPEAAKDIDETNWPGVTLLKARMNTDLLTDDLKKKRSSNQSFWLMGQPDVELRKRKDGQYEVEVNGFDYFDTAKGELVSGGKGKIAVWMLDTDYDERSLFPHQVFFPLAGKKEGWYKLKKDIRAELDESLLDQFHGTISLPFEAGENHKIAVKIVDDRGIESLKIMQLD